MFDSLAEKLKRAFANMRGSGTLSEEQVEAALSDIRTALLEADVNFKVVKRIIANVRRESLGTTVLSSLSPAEQVLRIVRDQLVEILGKTQARLKTAPSPPSVYLIVGLQGAGKTTSTGKLARWLASRGRRPLLVSVDVRRPAAREQLAIVARQVSQPVYEGSADEKTPLQLTQGALREAGQVGRDTVLVDTAGRLHLDQELMEELEELKRGFRPPEILFVADGMTGQDAVRSAKEFHKRLSVTGVILTKMDGDARGGAALSIRQVTGCPIKFLGTGEKPKAFEAFHPDRIVSRLLGMGDFQTLVEKAQEEVGVKERRTIKQRLLDRQFTMEDFRKQLQQVQKMGSMRSLQELIPTGGPFGQVQMEDLDIEAVKRSEAVLNSMTAQERANEDVLNASRRRRIAQGSGTSVQHVNEVVKEFRVARSTVLNMAQKVLRRKRLRRTKRRKRRARRGGRRFRSRRARGRR